MDTTKNRKNRLRRGFTLVEIMIVVLIIGILLAIAVPNFIRAREASRTKACIANLKRIDSATEQYAMDNKLTNGSGVTLVSLVSAGATGYIKSTPTCPSNGSYPTTLTVGTLPNCTVNPNPTGTQYNHVLP